MPDYTKAESKTKEPVRTLSARARTALEKLPTPEVVSVMEDLLRIASEAGNNNNNNNNGGGGGGGGSIVGTPAREELLQKLDASLSDDQLQGILRQQGIL